MPAKWFIPGRIFLSRIFHLAAGAHCPSHWLHLNTEFRLDLEWWHRFLDGWNEASLCKQFDHKEPEIVLTAGTSGRWGCGAYLEEGGSWFQYEWQGEVEHANIIVNEFLPIVMAYVLWGRE